MRFIESFCLASKSHAAFFLAEFRCRKRPNVAVRRRKGQRFADCAAFFFADIRRFAFFRQGRKHSFDICEIGRLFCHNFEIL